MSTWVEWKEFIDAEAQNQQRIKKLNRKQRGISEKLMASGRRLDLKWFVAGLLLSPVAAAVLLMFFGIM